MHAVLRIEQQSKTGWTAGLEKLQRFGMWVHDLQVHYLQLIGSSSACFNRKCQVRTWSSSSSRGRRTISTSSSSSSSSSSSRSSSSSSSTPNRESPCNMSCGIILPTVNAAPRPLTRHDLATQRSPMER